MELILSILFLLSSILAIWFWCSYKTKSLIFQINVPSAKITEIEVEAFESRIVPYYEKLEEIHQKEFQIYLTINQIFFLILSVCGLFAGILLERYIDSISVQTVLILYFLYLMSLLVLIYLLKLLIVIISKTIESKRKNIKSLLPKFKPVQKNLGLNKRVTSRLKPRSVIDKALRMSMVTSGQSGAHIGSLSKGRSGMMHEGINDFIGNHVYAFEGNAKIPVKVYVNRGEHISIVLKRSTHNRNDNNHPLKCEDNESGKSITTQIKDDGGGNSKLKIEVQAACIEVKGDNPQLQPLSSNALKYHWNFGFSTSGDYTINFIISKTNPKETIEIGIIEHKIKVVKIDHLTANQVHVLATLASFFTGIFALLVAMKKLGIL